MAPHLQRVLVVDPNLAASRLLTELVKELGASQRMHASTTKRALEIAKDWQPQLIFVEFAGPGLDGVEFTERLRRSTIAARKGAGDRGHRRHPRRLHQGVAGRRRP